MKNVFLFAAACFLGWFIGFHAAGVVLRWQWRNANAG